MTMANAQGDFVWYELMTTDADAAQAFYEPLIGWTFADSGTPDVDYRIGSMAGTEVVGMMQLSEEMQQGGARPAWIGYIAVDDIGGSIAALKDKGGHLFMGPNHLDGVGHMAMVADPQGAPFYLMQPEGEGSESFAKHEPRDGHCAWNELVTEDPDAAGVFYSALFGWQKGEAMEMGELGLYQIYNHADYGLGAMMARPEQMPVSLWCYYFRVPEIGAAKAYFETNGGQVVNGPMEVPGGEFALQAVDPQGAIVSLIGK